MERLNAAAENLKKRGFDARLFSTAAEARTALLEQLQTADSVAMGGSATIQSLDIVDALKAAGKTVIWHWLPQEEGRDARREAMNADVYLCSANAVTEAGQLLFIDGTCNRVGALCYGPRRVILVVGGNKLTEDLETGFRRIRECACPPNAKRLGLNTPCALTGKCTDCSSPQRMCNAFLTLERRPGSHPVEVWLVNEALGF